MTKSFVGGIVNLFERDAAFLTQAAAGFELGRGLDNFAVQFANFDWHHPKGGLHLNEFASQLAAFGRRTPNPERAGFAEQHLGKFVGVDLGAQNRQQNRRTIFLHLNGRVKDVERAGGQRAVDEVAQDFRIEIVQIRFQHRNGIDLPIVRGGCFAGRAQDSADDVGARLVVTRAKAKSDFLRHQAVHGLKPLGELGQQRGAGGSDQFVRFFALVDRDATIAENRQRGGRGNGETPMGAVDPTGAFDHCGRNHQWFVQQFQADAGTDDINNGVDCADFVEVDLFRRQTVDFTFGNGDTMKYRNRLLLDPVRKRAARNQFLYLRVIPPVLMVMLVVVRVSSMGMFVPVTVGVMMVMPVLVRLIMIMVLMLVVMILFMFMTGSVAVRMRMDEVPVSMFVLMRFRLMFVAMLVFVTVFRSAMMMLVFEMHVEFRAGDR